MFGVEKYAELISDLDGPNGSQFAVAVTELLKAGQIEPSRCGTLLKIRGLEGNIEAVFELLDLGVRIEKQEDKDAITNAIPRLHNSDALKIWALIFAGADIQKLDDKIREKIPTPLCYYIDKEYINKNNVDGAKKVIDLCKNNPDLLKIVLTAQMYEGNVLHTLATHNMSLDGEEIDASNREQIAIIIIEACREHPGLLDTLLNAENSEKNTPLTTALQMYYPSMRFVKILVDASQKIEDCDVGGLPLLNWVVSGWCQAYDDEKKPVIESLLNKNPALIHSTDEDGCQPLHWACHESLALVPLLLERGANPNAKTKTGTRLLNDHTPITILEREEKFGRPKDTKYKGMARQSLIDHGAKLPEPLAENSLNNPISEDPSEKSKSKDTDSASESLEEDSGHVVEKADSKGSDESVDEEQETEPGPGPKTQSMLSTRNILVATSCVSSIAILCYASYRGAVNISNISEFCSYIFGKVKDYTNISLQK